VGSKRWVGLYRQEAMGGVEMSPSSGLILTFFGLERPSVVSSVDLFFAQVADGGEGGVFVS